MKLSDLLEFLEVEPGVSFAMPHDRAIAYFRQKGLRATFSYADHLGEANDRAFTVAKMMDVDLLAQVRASLDSALANGTPFREWAREVEPLMQRSGWWGRKEMLDPSTGAVVEAQLGAPWRLETIFRTNMQAASAAGQWQTIQEQAANAPFLMYDAVDDIRTRQLHKSWDRKCLPVTSPWWDTHFPPNGWNCRCGVIQLDAEELQALGLKAAKEPPDDGTFEWRNPRTGKTSLVPNGIDPGWDRNSGRGLATDPQDQLVEKVKPLPASMKKAVEPIVRPPFDTSTEAGKWHDKAFAESPSWIRAAVLKNPDVRVEYGSKDGAFASLGKLINMGGHRDPSVAASAEVWRHEFGHIVDHRIGEKAGAFKRSAADDYIQAQGRDRAALIEASGKGRASKAQKAREAELVKAYEDTREALIDAERAARPLILAEMAQKAGVDFEAFVEAVRAGSLILEGVDLQSVGAAVRLGKILKALELGDAESFVRFWTYLGEPGEAATRAASWRRDGAIASLSDLIGATTSNKLAPHKGGFSGHSDSYYRARVIMGIRTGEATEAFANLFALGGHRLAFWWAVVRRFTPAQADLFERIITGGK